MKALGQILLYLAAAVLIGALAAPPLYWLTHAAAAHIDSAWLAQFAAKTEFPRYFHRAVSLAALALLPALLKTLRIGSLGAMGLRRDRRGPRRLVGGLIVSLASLLLLAAMLLCTGVYRFRGHILYSKLAWLPVTAAGVAFVEEFLFRGALQGAVRKTTVDGFALTTVALVYAAVHFLSPHGASPPVVHWWSGLALLPSALWQFQQPALLLGGFTTLFAAGIALGHIRVRTSSLWMPAGLHAGWIIGKMGLGLVTRPGVAWPWIGPDLLTGLGPLLAVLASWGAAAWLIRDDL